MRQLMALILALLFSFSAPQPTPVGYTADITSNRMGNIVYISVNANHNEDKIYNACEIKLTYDTRLLHFNAARSTLGCAAYRENNGEIFLIDFGEDKPLGKPIYVFAFDIIHLGDSTIALTHAAFSTSEKAATQDIEPIVNKPNNLTIRVK